ncbi:hypothetical protein [Streptomyces canus]|uniref:hypothetical protein n=1 Tax=Streptomyces canus TaxID=58343 RepID=UPI0022523E40|nr:hypothetical protein [Streptomyces canus]MCX4862234.1 hypothetical protein [Streptomyces canus]
MPSRAEHQRAAARPAQLGVPDPAVLIRRGNHSAKPSTSTRKRSAGVAVTGIRTQADRLGLSVDQRAAADRACHYLENNATHLHCDQALAAGWPIASGIVEGAARHLVADHLDSTGSRWTVPEAEAVLGLRALISNGDFPEYWTFRTHRERERLYPRPDQHNYELLA